MGIEMYSQYFLSSIKLRELSFPKIIFLVPPTHGILLFHRDRILRMGQILGFSFSFFFQISVFLMKKKPWEEDKGL